ncbi:SPASM domain-containing protein [Brachyspira pilosicoli]|uniref:radical SAM/SPASM domain-containing protein n=1 Tax=Brachyspira pilosicoli TaxID=52584 RepID=UPI00254376A6|nr:radical SAM/SPASM domain-containing protein [Brachyspira pilosicoli]WIH85463.1 SPASM domain-containing protein [Brachyspira pilosicoli]
MKINDDITKIINDLVWWIPFKNKRNNLRNLLTNNIAKELSKFKEELNKANENNKLLEEELNKANENNVLLKEELCKTKENNLNIIKKAINSTIQLTTQYNDCEIMKNIFKENVKLVEIGISSFCNRKCWFCPNSIVDRFSRNIELDEYLFIKILKELQEIDYSNSLYLHRYNEPLYNKDLLLKRIKQAREYLPKSIIKVVSNGDYLTKEYLKELEEYGVNELYISYYYNGNNKYIEFDLENVIKPGMLKLINKLAIEYSEYIKNDNEYYMFMKYKNLNIEYKSLNMEKMGNDRGGVIEDVNIEERTSQCFLPNMQVSIDYDGTYSMCCNIRSDLEAHKDYIIGNIRDNTIFELFTNDKIINIRKKLLVYGKKEKVCANCADYRPWYGLF